MLSSPTHRCSPGISGRNRPGNKRFEDGIKILIYHLKKLPSYESHYCRKETSKKPSHLLYEHMMSINYVYYIYMEIILMN